MMGYHVYMQNAKYQVYLKGNINVLKINPRAAYP